MRSKGQSAYARQRGVSQQRIHTLVKEGKLKLTDTSQPGEQQARWHAERLAAQTRSPARRVRDYYEAKIAKLEFELRELELAEKQRTVLNVDAASRLITRGIMEMRSQLLALEVKLPPRVLGLTTLPEIRQIVSQVIRHALDGISRIKLADDVLDEDLESVGAPAAPQNQRVGRQVPPAQPGKQRRTRPVGDGPG